MTISFLIDYILLSDFLCFISQFFILTIFLNVKKHMFFWIFHSWYITFFYQNFSVLSVTTITTFLNIYQSYFQNFKHLIFILLIFFYFIFLQFYQIFSVLSVIFPNFKTFICSYNYIRISLYILLLKPWKCSSNLTWVAIGGDHNGFGALWEI